MKLSAKEIKSAKELMEKHSKEEIHVAPNGHFYFDRGNALRSVNDEKDIVTLDKSGKVKVEKEEGKAITK